MDLGAMLIGISVTLGIKVIVTIFCIKLLARLYSGPKETRPKKIWRLLPPSSDLSTRLLTWSLVLFFISEIFCGVETWIILQSNLYTRLLHAGASALGMGFFALGMYVLLDKRVIKYSEPPCALIKVCKSCPKAKGEECFFHYSLILVSCFLLLAPLVLFLAPTDLIVGNPRKFILPFPEINSWYDNQVIPFIKAHYSDYKPIDVALFLPQAAQIFEFNVLPLIAMTITAVGIYFVRSLKTETKGIRLLVFAAGFITYPFFELICYRVSGDLFLGAVAHEIAEFWFLLIVAEVIRRFHLQPDFK